MAGTKVAELVASLRLDAKNFSSALKESESKLTKFGTSAQKAGTKMTMALTLPIAGAAAGAIKAAADFETSMTKIQSMVGLSAETVKGFEQDVLRLAGETAQAPRELADAMFFITSAGLRGATAVEALEASAKAAAIGMGDAEVIADAVTNAINGYGAANITAAEATDVLAKTVEQGKASAEDLAPQFGRLIPMAAELGISFDQVGGGLAFLTRASGNASQSTSSLRGILRTLIKPSQMARQTLEDVGLSVEDLRSAADDDLLGALVEMRDTLEANGKEMGAVFEDSEALAGALQLTGAAAAEAAGVMDEMTRAAGTLDRGMAAVVETSRFQMSQAMTDLKIVMIDLGQKLIPVVVPLIQQLAGFVKDLADKFNNLSPFMQKVVLALGGIAMAAGPALMAIGSVARGLGSLKRVGDGVIWMITGGGGMAKGIGTLAAKLGMSTGGLGFAAVGAAAIIGGGLFLALKGSREEAQRDQDRMKLLREEMIDTGEASLILSTDVDELTERLKALADVAADGEEEIEKFNGRMVLMQELIGRDAKAAFDTYITDMEHHNELTAAGSDAYQDLAGSFNMMKSQLESNIRKIEQHRDVLGEDTDQVIEALRNGDLTIHQLKNILTSLDKTADAYDDDRKAQEKSAKQYFESAENVLAYEDALNAGQKAVVDNLVAEGEHARALEMVIAYTGTLEARQARLTAETEALAVAQEQATATANRQREAGLGVTAAVRETGEVTEAAMERSNAALARNLFHWRNVREEAAAVRAEELAAAQAMAEGVENRLRAGQSSFRSGMELVAAKNAADEEQRIADHLAEQREILQGLKDDLQDRIDIQRDSLAVAEANLAALEAQAEAARAPVEALKAQAAAEREGFDAVRGMWDAQNGLNDATQRRQNLIDEIAAMENGIGEAIDEATEAYEKQLSIADDLKDTMSDLNDDIEDADNRRLAVLDREGQFQRGLTHELNEQRLAYHDINAQVAELEGRQRELSEGALQAQRDLVSSLQTEQSAITEVEQALIDLGLVSATDAAQANISAKQAKNLLKLRTELEEVEEAVEAGEASMLDLWDAQDDLTKAIKNAKRPIDGLERATQDLARMEKEAERIGLQLTVARDKLTVATEAKERAEDTAARTSEAVAEIDAELVVLNEKLTEATNAETEARDEANKMKDVSAIQDAELTRLNKELEVAHWDVVAAQYGVRDAEIALAEAGDKVNDAISRMRDISPELADEMEVLSDVARLTYPEFDTMRARLLELEPQIASAKSEVDRLKDAIADLVAQMEVLNRTKVEVNIDTGTVTTTPPPTVTTPTVTTPTVTTPTVTTPTVTTPTVTTPTATTPTVTTPTPVADPVGDYLRMVDDLDFQGKMDLASMIGAFANPLEEAIARAGGGTWTEGHFNPGDTSSLDFFASAQKGGLITKGGLVNLHAGEVVTPAGGGATYITVNVEGSVSSERELVESIRKGLLRSQQSGKKVVLN